MAIMGGNGNGDGHDGCSNPNTVACEGVLDQAHDDLNSAILQARSNADADSGHLLGQVVKAVYHASGASDVVGCATHPSVGGCAKAALTVAIAVGTDGASAVGETVAESVGKDVLENGAKDAAEAGTEHTTANAADDAASCTETMPHSFTAPTPVLMGDGSSKPISQIKVGDIISNADPASHTEQKHRVDAVIVTHTDHDFADVTVATPNGDQTIHTTNHHPFYEVDKSSFVEAVDLKAGDKLKTPDGTTVAVVAVRLFHASQTTYDLTIDGLHTYYVEAGDTPVLVHNCGGYYDGHDPSCTCEGQPGNPVTLQPAPAPQSASSAFTAHALQRLSQRGVSPEDAEQVLRNQPFSYFHDDQWKTGYYDSGSEIFIAKTIDGNINTVMTNVNRAYINRLMGGR